MPTPMQPRLLPYYLGHALIYVGLIIVGLVMIWLAIKTFLIYTAYQRTTGHLAAIETLLTVDPAVPAEAGAAQISHHLREAAAGMETLYRETAPFLPLLSKLGGVPGYGDDLRALSHLVTTGQDLSQAGLSLLDVAEPVFSSDPVLKSAPFLPVVGAALADKQEALGQAEARLRQYQAALNEFDPQQLSPKIAHRVEQLQQVLPQAITGLQVAQLLPSLLAIDSPPQTYLILTQNADELRPAGGYINAAGHLVVDQGQIVKFVMQDSYAIDQFSETSPHPPDPLYQYMGAEYWALRDAAWSPNFPTAARTALALYQLGQGIDADGVIALDQHALLYLLPAFGPLEVEGEQVTGDNVLALMRRHWAPAPGQAMRGGSEWWLQRKSFMMTLAETMRHQFENSPESINFPALAKGWQQALLEKHILVYLENTNGADLLTRQNWAGSLRQTPGDYLMVTDANVGFNKAGAMVERVINYRADLTANGAVHARARLLFAHTAKKRAAQCSIQVRYDPVYEQNMQRCYWNYMSLLVPDSAQLISAPNIVVDGTYLLRGQSTSGEVDVARLNSGKMSWSRLFLLSPEEEIALEYVYNLPAGTAEFLGNQWEYNLYLQKQPGTLASPVNVTINLPEGAELVESHPAPMKQAGVELAFQLQLKTDQPVKILYRN